MKENISLLIYILDNSSNLYEDLKSLQFEDKEIILKIIRKIVKTSGRPGMPIDELTEATYNEYLKLKSI